MNRRSLFAFTLLLLSLLIVSCAPDEPTGPILPSPSPTVFELATPTIEVTERPTEAPRNFIHFQHPTGVLSMSVPDDWEVIDESTARHLKLRMIPPPGFGSRVGVEVMNVGTLTPDEVKADLESEAQLLYGSNPAYTEVEQITLDDGRQMIDFLYIDSTGAQGRERLIARYNDPYLALTRVFVAEADTLFLSQTIEQVASSVALDTNVSWGAQVVAINPGELLFTNTSLWQEVNGDTRYFTGELYNASPADISDIEIRAAFCDDNGVVVGELTDDVDVAWLAQGDIVPFSIPLEGLPDEVEACSTTANAIPASIDPNVTREVSVVIQDSNYHQWRRDLTLDVELFNPSLAPVFAIEVVFAVYDGENRIVGYQIFRPELEGGQLDPGQIQNFELVIAPIGSIPDHLATLVQARYIGQNNPSIAPTKTP